MKLAYLIMKDLTVFFRDIRSFIMLFITPVAIVLLIGTAFLNIDPHNVPIMTCSDGNSEIYSDVVNLLKNSGVFSISETEGNCQQIISDNIKISAIRAGIYVPDLASSRNIEITLDNTKPVSIYIESYFNLVNKDLNQRLISSRLQYIKDNIDTIDQEIEDTYTDLKSYSSDISDSITILNKARTDVDLLEYWARNIYNTRTTFTQGLSVVDSVQNDVESLSVSLISLENSYNSTLDTIQQENYTLFLVVQDQAADIGSRISEMKDYLKTIQYSLPSIRNVLSNSQQLIDSKSIEPIVTSSTYIGSRLEMIVTTLSTVRNNIDVLADDVLDIKDIYREKITSTEDVYEDPVTSSVTRYFGGKRYIDFVFPTLLIMIIMLMATFLSAISFIRQRSTGLLKRISISPTGMNFFLLEKISVNSIIALLPTPFILLVGIYFLNVDIGILNFFPILGICAITVVIFVLLGLIISSFSKTESTAILLSLIIVTPMMFLTGAFTPSEAFPTAIRYVSTYLPITLASRLIEGTLFYQLPSWFSELTTAYMAIYILVAALIARLVMGGTFKK